MILVGRIHRRDNAEPSYSLKHQQTFTRCHQAIRHAADGVGQQIIILLNPRNYRDALLGRRDYLNHCQQHISRMRLPCSSDRYAFLLNSVNI
jgi:hypothetical protein